MAIQLEDLVGAKMVIGIPGTELTAEIIQQFKDTRAGGVIFYRINFESPEQIKKLISDLEEALGRKLLVCVDHEGGRVVMYGGGVTVFPDNLAFGRTNEPHLVEEAGLIAAKELRALGADVNFAPVMDVLTDSYAPNIGIRSYGKDWKKAGDLGCAFIRGLQRGGVSATAKHFPGKGHAPVDAHLKLPIIQSTWEEMKAVHLRPFMQAIEAGVDCVMTSHPFYPRLDPTPGNIATFSRRIVYDYLRKELGYQGVIVSDDLEMGAVKDVCPIDAAAVKTVAAGHDLILSCHDATNQRQIFRALADAYKHRLLPMNELEESVKRIEELKAKRKKRFEGDVGPADGGRELAKIICRKAVQILQDPSRSIPLSEALLKNAAVIFPQLSSLASKIMVEKEFEDEAGYFRKVLGRFPGRHETVVYPIEPDGASIEKAKALSGKSSATLFFCYDAHLYPAEQKLLSALRESAKTLIVIFMRDPYDADFLHSNDSALTCFGWRRCQIEACLNRLAAP